MGCDIHAYIETKRKDDTTDHEWSFLGSYRFSRNYLLFALMAGVRRYQSYPNPKVLEAALRKRGATRLDDPNLSKEEGVVIMLEGCDSGITGGQPSFDEKGIPENISWKTAEEYTLNVIPDDDKSEEEHTCTLSQANSWVAGGSSEVWDAAADGSPMRVTHPDMHTASWLDASEVRMLAERFRLALLDNVSDAKKAQADCVKWAMSGLEAARLERNDERVAFFERELERESDWSKHNPLTEHAYVATEALSSLMASLDAHGLNTRVVFWFDN